MKQKGLLLLVDQSLQLAGSQKLLNLLRGHHSKKDLKEEEEGQHFKGQSGVQSKQ